MQRLIIKNALKGLRLGYENYMGDVRQAIPANDEDDLDKAADAIVEALNEHSFINITNKKA